LYEDDDFQADGTYIIWPEFEREDGIPLPEEAEIPTVGFASMWIQAPDMRPVHQQRLAPGVRGHLMVGPHKVADVEVVELVGLNE
jgi:hypothetical protein